MTAPLTQGSRAAAGYKKFTFPNGVWVFTAASFYAILTRELSSKEALIIKSYDFDPDEQRDLHDYELPQEADAPAKKKSKKKKRKQNRGKRVIATLLSILLFCEALYCFVVFTDIPVIKNLREAYIETALSTLSHRWLADYFLPKYMVDQVQFKMDYAQQLQRDYVSNNDDRYKPTESTSDATEAPTEDVQPTEPDKNAEQEAFYELFWELSRTSFEEYLDSHPEALADGWDNIYINEAGLDDDGTTIYTTMGEQVLAIDAKNKILLVRVTGTGYLGVLAIAKDPAQLRCHASEGLDGFRYGQSLEDIVLHAGGVLGMSGSGFIDPEGDGNGGLLAGYAMCEGQAFGDHYGMAGYKRIELTDANKFYVVETQSPVGDDVTDAVEFSPVLVVDGELTVGGFMDWNAINPRACIGQSRKGEIMMLIIEGRQITRSIGTDVETCANILMRHDAYTAMNLDGGTSAVMWYDGEYVTQCSNTRIKSRLLPNAWVYGNYEG